MTIDSKHSHELPEHFLDYDYWKDIELNARDNSEKYNEAILAYTNLRRLGLNIPKPLKRFFEDVCHPGDVYPDEHIWAQEIEDIKHRSQWQNIANALNEFIRYVNSIDNLPNNIKEPVHRMLRPIAGSKGGKTRASIGKTQHIQTWDDKKDSIYLYLIEVKKAEVVPTALFCYVETGLRKIADAKGREIVPWKKGTYKPPTILNIAFDEDVMDPESQFQRTIEIIESFGEFENVEDKKKALRGALRNLFMTQQINNPDNKDHISRRKDKAKWEQEKKELKPVLRGQLSDITLAIYKHVDFKYPLRNK